MSYVLDALEKSEQERLVGEIPNAGNIGRAPVPSARRQTSWPMLVVGAGLVLAGGWYFLSGERAAKPVVTPPNVSHAPVTTQEESKSSALPLAVTAVQTPLPVQRAEAGAVGAMSPAAAGSGADHALAFSRTLTPPSPAAAVNAPALAVLPVANQARFAAKVAGIVDGCTVEVKNQNNILRKVQLAGISCLPPQSLAGKEARIFTTHSIFMQNVVVLVVREEANLLVADLFDRDSSLLNRALVRQGFANALDERFRAEEQEARLLHRGLWQNPDTWGNVP
ncbi:MAG: thermonuclease family protein [Magnetococcales bacterium]|nr:thermonuclease family protein [Magnetococcales bacterium]